MKSSPPAIATVSKSPSHIATVIIQSFPTIRRLPTTGLSAGSPRPRLGKEDARGGPLDLWVLGSHVLNIVHCLGGGLEPALQWSTRMRVRSPPLT